jgi:hypothetical protein
MSVSPVSASTYAPFDPSSSPAGLDAINLGSPKAPGPAVASTPGQPTVYQTEYATLQTDDDAELVQTSLATPQAAAANVQSVLAQAAALQQQQQAALQQQQQALNTGQTTVNADPTDALNVPSLGSIIQASDTAADSYIQNLVGSGTGSTVNTTA